MKNKSKLQKNFMCMYVPSAITQWIYGRDHILVKISRIIIGDIKERSRYRKSSVKYFSRISDQAAQYNLYCKNKLIGNINIHSLYRGKFYLLIKIELHLGGINSIV